MPGATVFGESASVYVEMPAAFMDNSDRGSPSDSQSPQDWRAARSGEHKHRRKDKNRDAARKSRKKQTERADVLHEELQTLERSNAAYVKEIAELRKEIQMYSTALEQHEANCTKLFPCGPSEPVTAQGGPSTATPSSSDFTLNPDRNPLTDFGFLSGPPHNSGDLSLTDLFDSSDWSHWDPLNCDEYLPQL